MSLKFIGRKRILFLREMLVWGVWGGKYVLSEMCSAMDGPDNFSDAAKRIEKELRME